MPSVVVFFLVIVDCCSRGSCSHGTCWHTHGNSTSASTTDRVAKGTKVPHVLLALGVVLICLLALLGLVSIAAFSSPSLEPLDKLSEIGGLFCFADKGMLEELLCGGAVARVTLETEVNEFLEWSGKRTFELRRWVLGNEEKDLHWMQVGVRRFAHRKLDGCNSQTPNVGLEIVAALLDDFWTHPVRCADKSVLLGHGRCELAGNTKVGKLDVASCREQDVGRLDVSMQLAFSVQVLETFEKLAKDNCNVVFAESTGFHL